MSGYVSKEQKQNLEEVFLHSQLLNYYSQYSILERTWMPIILLIDFKLWYIQPRIEHSAFWKEKDILLSEITWVNIKGIVLSQTSQSPGQMLLGSIFMRSIKPSNSGWPPWLLRAESKWKGKWYSICVMSQVYKTIKF